MATGVTLAICHTCTINYDLCLSVYLTYISYISRITAVMTPTDCAFEVLPEGGMIIDDECWGRGVDLLHCHRQRQVPQMCESVLLRVKHVVLTHCRCAQPPRVYTHA